MHILAKRILDEQVKPKIEMLLSEHGKLSSNELMYVKEVTCIAKELLECDVMLKKIEGYPKADGGMHSPDAGRMNL